MRFCWIDGRAHTDGTPNVLAVKVRNQVPSSRWYSGSGIHRDVRLVVGAAFVPVSTSRVRLDMTSRVPGTTRGFLAITEASA